MAFGLANDDSGKTTGLKMSDKNVILRVAVRRGTGTPVVQDLEFVKTPDRNHATFSGQITIPSDGTGDYTISAILMKEAGADGKVYGTATDTGGVLSTTVNFNRTNIISHSASEIEANIPYITEWQRLTINGNGAAEPVTLALKPFGTLLRMRIKNESSVEQTFGLVRFTTNAFSPSVAFEMTSAQGSYPEWRVANVEYVDLDLGSVQAPAKVGDNPGYSPWLYTVVYPRKTVMNVTTIGSLRVLSGTSFFKAFSSTQYLPHGSVPLTLVYTGQNDATFEGLVEKDEWGSTTERPKLAIEYVSQYSFDKTKAALVSDHLVDNPNIGRFTFDEATALSTPVVIDGVKYSTPTKNELMSIIPPRFDIANGILHENVVLRYINFVEPDVKIGSVTRNYASDYVKSSPSATAPLYALRFKNTKDCTAYRYRTITLAGTTTRAMVIDCIYIGFALYDIDDIAQSQFWTDRTEQIVSRTFPLYGEAYSNDPTTLRNYNTVGTYLTSTRFDHTSWYASSLSNSSWGIAGLKSNLTIAPIRPWIRD